MAAQVNFPGPGGLIGNLLEPVAPGIGAAGPDVTKAVAKAGVTDVLHGLNLGGWLLRVAEILAGIVLLGIGLNAMLGGRPLKVVTGAAGAVGKVVP